MSVSQLLSHIQSLSESLENASALSEELLHCCQASDGDFSIADISDMFGQGKGINIDGTPTIKDYLELAVAELDFIEDMLE
jgi:hypothetical protein